MENKETFNLVASEYDRYRPVYPSDMFDDIFTYAKLDKQDSIPVTFEPFRGTEDKDGYRSCFSGNSGSKRSSGDDNLLKKYEQSGELAVNERGWVYWNISDGYAVLRKNKE